MPPAAQVRDALERILSSGMFARSERARDLLRYLVDQDLAGHADRLKGFSIAVDVFGKDDRFDPATDTVVRVQAGRLRDLIEHYYAEEGAGDPLRIAIPRGSYVPVYTAVASDADDVVSPVRSEVADTIVFEETASPATPAISQPYSVSRYGIAAAGIVMLVLVAGAAVYAWLGPQGVGPEAIARSDAGAITLSEITGSTSREFLPSVYLAVSTQDQDADRWVSALRRGLSSFDTVRFIARPPQDDETAVHRRTDFVFLVDAGEAGAIHLELQNVLSGKVLLSRDIAVSDLSRQEIEDEVAALLTTVVPVSGVIYASVADEGAETVLTRCLLLNERYYRDQNAQAHRAAYECLEQLAEADAASSLVYSELAGLHFQGMTARYRYFDDRPETKALEFARKAVELAPNSAYAHRSMGYVLSRSANPEEALRWTRKAYELNTFDLGMAASYGYGLIFAGLYDEGTPILHRAATAASVHPTWWDYGLALGKLMLGDARAGANAAVALSSSQRAHYLAVRLVFAHELGNAEEAGTLRARLLHDHPNFSADPEAVFQRGSYPEDMTLRLLQSLREAGLVGAS